MCIFAISICKRCIDLPKDIPSNVLGYERGRKDGDGGGGFHLASKLLRKHLSIKISRHCGGRAGGKEGRREGGGQKRAGGSISHTHTH